MAKYSVILPVRNGGHHGRECVQSILSQTFADFNLIVLDNCSTDGTPEWLSSLNDPRIKILPATEPLTIEENWGRIKEVDMAEFITLIGHDDILLPSFLQTMDSLIAQYPDASLYHSHFDFIDTLGKKIRSSKPMEKTYGGADFMKAFLVSSIDSMGTGYVMRSKHYREIGGIPVRYPNLLFADFELWISFSIRSFVAVSTETCFAFRLHQSTTHTSHDQKLHAALQCFIDYLSNLQHADKKLAETINHYGAQFLLHYCTAYAHRLLRTPLKDRQGLTVQQLIEQTKLMAYQLGIAALYNPEKKSSLRLAMRIDKNKFLRTSFLLFKRMYKKPVL